MHSQSETFLILGKYSINNIRSLSLSHSETSLLSQTTLDAELFSVISPLKHLLRNYKLRACRDIEMGLLCTFDILLVGN